MKDETRLIGLSLGADLCWPRFYQDVLARLDPVIDDGGTRVRFATERITIEPFDLSQPCRYAVVLDRLTPWYHTSREWIKKAVVMDGLYVLNNPFTLQAMQKHTSYAAMMRLGLPVPRTILIPPKEYEPAPDLKRTLDAYARLFDLGELGAQIGFPAYLKPYDGGAWVGVSRVESQQELQTAYDASGTRIMHLQEAIEPHDLFVRCVGVGPQVRIIDYRPDAPLHDRYGMTHDFLDDSDTSELVDLTLTINTFFGWDFNSCEALRRDDVYHPIDFANANPDSQVTSLHYHLPWLVGALLRWSLFCAATGRAMRLDLGWADYYDIADAAPRGRKTLASLGEVARRRLDADEFDSFCDAHLKDLDGVLFEYFADEAITDVIRAKVATLYPTQEVDEFTALFWDRIQRWRTDQAAAGDDAA